MKRGFVRNIQYLVIHHSASSLSTTLEDIRRWHIEEQDWVDVGYHWVIESDGSLLPGRSVYLMGAHVRGRNRESLGVCLVGDNTVESRRWNKKQIKSLKELSKSCQMVFPDLKVVGHRDLNENTLCPGLDVQEIL